jgi:hypothetical protein
VASGRQYVSGTFSVKGVLLVCDEREQVGSKLDVDRPRNRLMCGAVPWLKEMVSGSTVPASILMMKGCRQGKQALMIARFCAICWQSVGQQS